VRDNKIETKPAADAMPKRNNPTQTRNARKHGKEDFSARSTNIPNDVDRALGYPSEMPKPNKSFTAIPPQWIISSKVARVLAWRFQK
jgi:hypothetical protein